MRLGRKKLQVCGAEAFSKRSGVRHTPEGVTTITVLAATSPIEVLGVKMREQKAMTGGEKPGRKVETDLKVQGVNS